MKDSRELCATGKLRLHKFVSNSQRVMTTIPEEEHATVKDQDMSLSLPHIKRALGVEWCITSDTFKFRVQVKANLLTRRGVLSTVASIYDSLGFIAPFVLLGKQILQQMCREKVNWDEELPDHLKTQWESWIKELPGLGDVSFPLILDKSKSMSFTILQMPASRDMVNVHTFEPLTNKIKSTVAY